MKQNLRIRNEITCCGFRKRRTKFVQRRNRKNRKGGGFDCSNSTFVSHADEEEASTLFSFFVHCNQQNI